MNPVANRFKTQFRRSPDTQREYVPPTWAEWRRLCRLIPELDQLHRVKHANQKPPPRQTSDAAFVALVACLADPVMRKVVASLVWDLIGEDVVKLIEASNNMGE